MGVEQAVKQGIEEGFERHRQRHQEIVAAQLVPNEKIVAVHDGEIKAPFIIRIIPVIGQILGQAKTYLLAITDRRILIIRFSKSITKGRQFKELTASIPYSDLAGVEPSRGALTSSVTIRTKTGKVYSFVNLLKSAAEALAKDVKQVMAAARGQ